MSRNTPTAARGFSLIETLMVVAIVATLCAAGMPTFAALTADSRARDTHQALVASLALARSAAVNRGYDVVVCPSTDQNRCTGGDWWQHGWIVFQDTDHNGRRDPGEPMFQAEQTHTGVAIETAAGRGHVTYRPDGSATGTNLTFTLCDRRGTSHATALVINNGGRVRKSVPTPAEAQAACEGVAKG